MAIDFPDSPSNNDIYTVNGKRWIYSSGKWSIYGTTAPDATASDTAPAGVGEGHIWYKSDTSQTLIRYDSTWVELGAVSQKTGMTNSATAPSSPVEGELWYDSDDGRAYVYYDDGSSQQWVEFGASPSGSTIALASYADSAARTTAIPSPTEADLSYLQDTNSVEVYDGSAWAAVGAGGGTALITSSTFSGSSTVSVDNCFTSSYNAYQIIFTNTASNNLANIYMRFRASGADTATGYDIGEAIIRFSDGYFSNDGNGNAQTLMIMGYTSTARTHHNITVWEPTETQYTAMWYNAIHPDYAEWGGGSQTTTTSFDGFTIWPSAGTISGELYVYGWVKS
jgi:hypothetical protein